MPFFEYNIIIRPLPRNETVQALKRVANLIWEGNGVIRKIEYLGYKKLPYKAKPTPDDILYSEADHFLCHVSLPQFSHRVIMPEIKLDTDIIKTIYYNANNTNLPEGYECTLDEELQTPFYRESVQPLLGNKNVRADVRNLESLKKLD